MIRLFDGVDTMAQGCRRTLGLTSGVVGLAAPTRHRLREAVGPNHPLRLRSCRGRSARCRAP